MGGEKVSPSPYLIRSELVQHTAQHYFVLRKCLYDSRTMRSHISLDMPVTTHLLQLIHASIVAYADAVSLTCDGNVHVQVCGLSPNHVLCFD